MRLSRAIVTAALLVLALLSPPVSAGAIEPPNVFGAGDRPTYQTNGVAWAAASAGDLVFVGGAFTAVRPPGASAGVNEVSRSNLVVLNASTGTPTSCAPSVTFPANPSAAAVRALAVSPDRRTLYIAGSFTSVQGVAQQHLAALDIATCSVVRSFSPFLNGPLRAVAATGTTVYFGGTFSAVSGTGRASIAAVGAVGATDAGDVLPWAPHPDRETWALAVRPDGGAVVIGGDFHTVNGADSHALAVVHATTGAVLRAYRDEFLPLASNVKDIAVDSTGFYVAAEGNGPGVFDGRIALDWSDYGQRWRDTCLGATQAVAVHRGVLYSGSHAHDCAQMDGFPEGYRRHLLAQSVDDPELLPWFPDTNGGIGEQIGPRDVVVAGADPNAVLYVVGEFTTVNGRPQQGITRFGQGDTSSGPSAPLLSLSSVRPGQVRVAWRLAVDPDDRTLTYRVYRDGSSTPIRTVSGTSTFWAQGQLAFTDTAVAAGSEHTYRVEASDGTTSVSSPWRAVFVRASTSAYRDAVLADGATFLWRYDELGDVFLADDSEDNVNGQLLGSGTFQVVPAAIKGDNSRAFSLSSGSTLYGVKRFSAPQAFTAETWFKTTTTAGGKLIGFGDRQFGASASYDRHVYMTEDGRLVFGVRPGAMVTITTTDSYNDGQWHHLAASQGPAGMDLYVDGERVGHASATSAARSAGYWRVGSDAVAGWPEAPRSGDWHGSLDETAVYPTALSATTVARHHALGTGSATPPPPPPQDTYGVAVYADAPLLYWRLGERTGSSAADSSGNGRLGAYSSGVTLGQPPAVAGTTDTSVALPGVSSGQIASEGALAPVPAYSQEAWVRTTSVRGGKLFGFGSSQTSSSSHDRHVYMRNDGRLVFGVNPGSMVTITSANAYNDGAWHHVVATQGASGMRLFVDGVQVASSSTAGHSGATAFWRVGGDNVSGWPSAPTSGWLAGSVDEAALYGTALSATQVRAHFGAGRPSATDNTPPTTPSPLSASMSSGNVNLSWPASTDDTGVVGYDVHRSSSAGFTPSAATLLRTVTGTSTTDTAVGVGTWHYRVLARDASGNASAPSPVATVTITDTTPPSTPVILGADGTPGQVALSWSASTDDVGVTQYAVFRSTTAGAPASQATRVAWVSGTSWLDESLAPGTYYYRVAASDAAGNMSSASAERVAVVPVPGATYRAVDPRRVLDTRNGTGAPRAKVGPGGTLKLQVTGSPASGLAPVGATAVTLNVTVTAPTRASYVSVYPTGFGGGPQTSNLNFVAGQTTATLVTAKVAADGSVTLYNHLGSVDLVADLQGSYLPGTGGSTYLPLDPRRVLDTRSGTGAPAAKLGSGRTLRLQVTGAAGSGLAPVGTTAVTLNVTAVGANANSYVSVYPTGYTGGPSSSNLNVLNGEVAVTNLVTTKVDSTGGVTFYNYDGEIDLVADLQGAFTSSSADSVYQPLDARRLLDTRTGTGAPQARIGRGTLRLQVTGPAGSGLAPVGSTAVTLSVTVTDPTAGGYVSVYPTGHSSGPDTSNLNFTEGETTTNLVVTKVAADGSVTFFNSAGQVHLVADVQGAYVQ